jgi:NADH dehydrogenase FAD-containing subunit
VTDYLGPALAAARTADGRVSVTAQLRVTGQDAVFAIGDAANVPEPKMGGRAARQAETLAANIRALIEGGELTDYQPMPPLILVPLGPDGGASQLPGQDSIAGPDITSQYKGQDLFVGRYRETFRL